MPFTDVHTLSERIHDTPQPELIRGLLQGAGHAPARATPDGYAYVSRETGRPLPPGDTLFLSPHPSDVSADFYPLLIHHLQAVGGSYQQLILTRGEKGDLPRDPAEVMEIRRGEEARSAAITRINIAYLTRKPGDCAFQDNSAYFPDGGLLDCLPAVTARLKEAIRDAAPRRLALPSLYPDHPDHLATALAAIQAVVELREEGFFHEAAHGPVEILTSDPEFALTLGQPWVMEALDQAAFTCPYQYRYHVDESGFIHPAGDVTHAHDPASFVFDGPIAVPPFIVLSSDEAQQSKLHALSQHATQIQNGKAYAQLIPAVDRLRAQQVETESARWATGLYPLKIPGVTPDTHPLIDALPAGSVFQLKRVHEGLVVPSCSAVHSV